MSSELYYQKYIKYKTKYNNLKTNTQMGGSTQKDENTQIEIGGQRAPSFY